MLSLSIVFSVPVKAATWQAWFAQPAAASCPSGDTPVNATSASTDTNGVVTLSYAAFPGLTSAMPSKGFNPKKESAALKKDLAQHGVSTEQAQKLAAHPASFNFCESTKLYAGFEESAGQGNASGGPSVYNAHYDGVWAGYSVDGGSGFNGVRGHWAVQQSHTGTPAPNYDATWIGVGGDSADVSSNSNASLIQEGTDMETGAGYRMWFEYVCKSCGNTIPADHGSGHGVSLSGSDAVGVGNQMTGSIYWNGTSEACLFMQDESTLAFMEGCVNNQVPFDNKSIEWIDEDGLFSDGYYMADFGQTNWTDQTSWDSSGNAESLSQFQASSNFSVVGNIATTKTNPSAVPPCSTSGIMAYPENITSANGGSSTTIWCSGG